jgi:hypothetical protein
MPSASPLQRQCGERHRQQQRQLASLASVAAGADWGGPAKPRIVYAVEGSVATIYLNNPAKHNALDLRGYLELPAVAQAVSEHSGVRVVVLRGEGKTAQGLPMSFGAGSDIAEFPELRMGDAAIEKYNAAEAEAAEALRSIPHPTIAGTRALTPIVSRSQRGFQTSADAGRDLSVYVMD